VKPEKGRPAANCAMRRAAHGMGPPNCRITKFGKTETRAARNQEHLPICCGLEPASYKP
jgi:hypothetical protein